MTKIERVERVSGNPNRLERALCSVAERIETVARRLGIAPGVGGHTPQPGGWWYRFDVEVPFTGTVLGFISGGGWRVKRPGTPWRMIR